jgi:hypothetical protein
MSVGLKVILKRDPLLGYFINVPAAHVETLREYLIGYDVPFVLNGDNAARLFEPGHGTFVFGAHHPSRLRDMLLDHKAEVEIDPAVVLSETSYKTPVNKLLTLGEPPPRVREIDCSSHGITQEHVPELIRMALDGELHTGPAGSPVIWAPIYALWSIAHLRAEEAIAPLLGLFRRADEFHDTCILSELPKVFAQIGPAGIGPLASYAADTSHGEWARVGAAEAIGKIGQQYPDTRAECVAHLSSQLDKFSEQTETSNGLIVASLLDLKAIEAAPIIEKAFAAGAVAEGTAGDWEEVQIELGLKPREETRAVARPKVGRNDPCPCGSGKKYKKCCLK